MKKDSICYKIRCPVTIFRPDEYGTLLLDQDKKREFNFQDGQCFVTPSQERNGCRQCCYFCDEIRLGYCCVGEEDDFIRMFKRKTLEKHIR